QSGLKTSMGRKGAIRGGSAGAGVPVGQPAQSSGAPWAPTTEASAASPSGYLPPHHETTSGWAGAGPSVAEATGHSAGPTPGPAPSGGSPGIRLPDFAANKPLLIAAVAAL